MVTDCFVPIEGKTWMDVVQPYGRKSPSSVLPPRTFGIAQDWKLGELARLPTNHREPCGVLELYRVTHCTHIALGVEAILTPPYIIRILLGSNPFPRSLSKLGHCYVTRSILRT